MVTERARGAKVSATAQIPPSLGSAAQHGLPSSSRRRPEWDPLRALLQTRLQVAFGMNMNAVPGTVLAKLRRPETET